MNLTSLEEDFQAIGLPNGARAPRTGASVPSDLTLMESNLAGRYGGSGRGGALAKMRALAEGRTPPRQGGGRTQPSVGRTPARVNRTGIQECVRRFDSVLTRPGPGHESLRTVTEGSQRVRNLVNEVNNLVNEMHQFDRQESVRGWANVSVIAELLARKTERMGRALGEENLVRVASTMRTLGAKAAKITDALKEGRNVPNIGPRFNQAMRYVVAGAGLVASLTEGPDAPIPPMAPPRPMGAGGAVPPDPNAMGGEGMAPMGGAPMPTQGAPGMGMEGDDPMAGMGGAPPVPGAPDPNDPLGMGPPAHEAMSDDDRVPYNQGADDPDLDPDDPLSEEEPPPDEEDPSADPLGMGQ